MAAQPEWVRLERLLKQVGFGELYDLPIVHGRPRLDRPLRYRSRFLLNPRESARSQPNKGDGLRDARFRDLVRICEQRGNVIISTLIIQDGLPYRVEIEGELSPQ